ncbi:Xyloglucan galactosyltransferase KATAMARI1 [Heracleum sosnowskyi]|uniref:Xyloglucan galactosyltransferase KATAMARI1 n=1 Tax=Heracleum sosnowskyi TaxID=360622 RepID=A0AAD8J9W6_9APIA|nr:Xyloglucan galactosyltransferase KATAMARI1 [Heracleum sosnowskyi]
MNHTTVTRCRNNFWLIVFTLFIFWYALLYVYDWSAGGDESSKYVDHSVSFAASDPDQTQTSDGHADFHVNETTGSKNVSNDLTVEKSEIGPYDENWFEDVENVKLLEKDLEPLMREADANKHDLFCSGRYIYVHDLPSRFNKNYIKQCNALSSWDDPCYYNANMGLGPELGNPQRVFMPTAWFATSEFSLDYIFHNRMKQYDCLTNDSSKAAAVFVPYYAGLDIARYLGDYHNNSERDADSLAVADWLRSHPEWEVMDGRDHFLVAGRITWDFRRKGDADWDTGNKLMLLPEFKNTTVLTVESSPWNKNDFAIPYPTIFHPSNEEEVNTWQNRMRRLRRRFLFSFVGSAKPQRVDSIRGEIIHQCTSTKRCRFLECRNKDDKCQNPIHVIKTLQSSIFCLQPPGDSFTRRSTFDSILAGCIPVFFSPGSAYVQYLWHLPTDFAKYSVLISGFDVKIKKLGIEGVLSRIPRRKVSEMREEVIRLIPRVIYADPRSGLTGIEDAFDVTLRGVIDRVETLRREIREGKNSSLVFNEENSWKYYMFGTERRHRWDHFFTTRRDDKMNN